MLHHLQQHHAKLVAAAVQCCAVCGVELTAARVVTVMLPVAAEVVAAEVVAAAVAAAG